MSNSHHDQRGQATFRGQIQDHDGRPLEGFVRVFRGDSPFTSRKITGAFLLQLPPDHYRIEVHAEGYQPVQIKLSLHANQGAAHQFSLNPIWHTGAGQGAVPGNHSEPVFPDAQDLSDLAGEAALPEPGENGKNVLSPDLSVEEMLYAEDDKDS